MFSVVIVISGSRDVIKSVKKDLTTEVTKFTKNEEKIFLFRLKTLRALSVLTTLQSGASLRSTSCGHRDFRVHVHGRQNGRGWPTLLDWFLLPGSWLMAPPLRAVAGPGYASAPNASAMRSKSSRL